MGTPRAAEYRDLEQRFKALERQVRELASAALRRPQFTLSEGDLTVSGGRLVVDGGDVVMLDDDGSVMFKLGGQLPLGDRGLTISREDGTAALEIRAPFNLGTQTVRLVGRGGRAIFAEEALVPTGIEKPWFEVPMQPVATPTAGEWGWSVPIDSGTWTRTHQAWIARQNGFYSARIMVKTRGTGTAAEVRVYDVTTGQALHEYLNGSDWIGTVPTGSTAWREVATPGLQVTNTDLYEPLSLAIECRRTAGSALIDVAVVESRGGTRS